MTSTASTAKNATLTRVNTVSTVLLLAFARYKGLRVVQRVRVVRVEPARRAAAGGRAGDRADLREPAAVQRATGRQFQGRLPAAVHLRSHERLAAGRAIGVVSA